MELTAGLLYIFIAVASAALYSIHQRLNYWKKRGIPHEVPHPFLGNTKGLRTTHSMGDIINNYYRKFKGSGPFAGIYLGLRPSVVLLEKSAIKNVLIKDFNNFTDRGIYYNEKDDPLTGHLFFLDGQKWRVLRNKLSPTFTSGKIKYMYPTLLQVADKFMNVLEQKVAQNPVLDVRDILGRFTTDIISSAAFGIETNSLTAENSEFLNLGRKSLEVQRHNPFVMLLIDSFPKLARKLGMRVLTEDVHQFFTKTIMQTLKYRDAHKIKRNDFVDILLELKDGDGLSALTIEEMVAQVFIFFLGGFETSSTTISMALFELAQNQHIQDRLREELTEEFDKYPGSSVPYECLMNIQYLDQVISETLRKRSTVPALFRRAVNDYVMPGHPNFVIEKGTPVFIPILGIQNDPEFYPNPEEFDPERFSPEIAKQRDAEEWLPFGDGPRNCIGMRFGKMQTRLGVACIIRNYRVSLCPETVIPIRYEVKSPVSSPAHQIFLKLEKVK